MSKLHKMKPFSLHNEEGWPKELVTNKQSDVTWPCNSFTTESKSPSKWMAHMPSRLATPYFKNSEFNK